MLTNSDVFMMVAMKAETACYSNDIMQSIIRDLRKETKQLQEAILNFWHYASGECGARLYLELAFRLSKNIDRQAVSYKI